MDFMSFICDYALIDPITLAYKVDNIDRSSIFATYEDIDENCFKLNIFPQGKVIPNNVIVKVSEVVKNYLFDE